MRADGLGFAWPGQGPLFTGVQLAVGEGETVALVGRSGCGKSTLLRLLAGLLQPTEGRVQGPGGRLAMVFQDARLLPWMTVTQNAEFALQAAGVPRSEWAPRVRPLLAEVGLRDASQLRPAQLSGGMAQRAALVRALCLRPQALLLDEPFGALDALLREELQGVLAGLLRRHSTRALLVTHDIEEALVLADRVLVMRGRPAELQLAAQTTLRERGDAGWRGSTRLSQLRGVVRQAL